MLQSIDEATSASKSSLTLKSLSLKLPIFFASFPSKGKILGKTPKIKEKKFNDKEKTEKT